MSILIKGVGMPKYCGHCYIGNRAICQDGCPLEDAEDLIKKIKQLEPYNNQDCPEWVINIIKGEING